MFDGGRYTAIYGVREPISFSPTYIALSGRWWGMGDEHGMRNHNYGPPSQMKPSKVTKNHQYSVEPEGFAWKSVQVLRRLVYIPIRITETKGNLRKVQIRTQGRKHRTQDGNRDRQKIIPLQNARLLYST